MTASWLVGLFALIGLGVSLAAGVFVAAVVAFGCVRAAITVLRKARGEMILYPDLHQAVVEWKERYPDKAKRYEGWRDD